MRYEALSIHDEVEVDIPTDVDDTNDTLEEEAFTLVGTLWTDKTVKFNFLKDTMATIWRPGKGVLAEEVEPNLFLFHFYHEKDRRRVLEDGPWSFEQHLLVLKKLEKEESPFDIDLTKAEFWIQIHNIPKKLINLRMAEHIGAHLGFFYKGGPLKL